MRGRGNGMNLERKGAYRRGGQGRTRTIMECRERTHNGIGGIEGREENEMGSG